MQTNSNQRTGLWFTIAGAALLVCAVVLGAAVLIVAGITGLMAPLSVQAGIVLDTVLAVVLFAAGFFKMRQP